MKLSLSTILILLFSFLANHSFAQCNIPGTLTVSNITATSAVVSWQTVAGAIFYKIHYRKAGSSVWTTKTAPSNSFTLTNLTHSATYVVQVRTNCVGTNSAYSDAVSFTTPLFANTDSLITAYAVWKYNDKGQNLDTAWRQPSYIDTGWVSGPAEIGYGDNDESTTVGFGPDANNKYVTTYFRKNFTVNNPQQYAAAKISLVRDDGAIVYINGIEVFRSNMAAGSASYNQYSLLNLTGADEYTWQTASLSPSVFVNGTNTIAVEMHQSMPNSADISFNLKLSASTASNTATLIRGAYLQMLTPKTITIRWKTDVATNSQVRYGTTMLLSGTKTDSALTTEHAVTITGLTANKKYFYSIGSTTQDLQGDANNFFTTALANNSTLPFRFWATGDFGNGSAQQVAVMNTYKNYVGNKPANFWIWLGDNAYESGTDAEYQTNVFNIYNTVFKSLPLYPAPGNHDYGNAGYLASNVLTTNWPYFTIFNVPTNAEAGGMASNTEKYYSYNFGNAHFISLDSYGTTNDTNSAMYQWLKSDLMANTRRWTVAYWHHPPYTMGSHNSDNDAELYNMRNRILPLLEQYKVDMVLCGHSHVYERSFFIHGHYGNEGTFNNSMKVDGSNGLSPGYTKTATANGTVYAVCGISGKGANATVQGSWPHAAMFTSSNTIYGSMVIDISKDTLEARCITSTGSIYDNFKIIKSGPNRIGLNEISFKEKDELHVYPNPFTDEISISYELTESLPVNIEIFNVLGKKVFELNDGTMQSTGLHELKLDGSAFGNTSGIFLINVTAGDKILKATVERLK